MTKSQKCRFFGDGEGNGEEDMLPLRDKPVDIQRPD
jgi:hypothetical protein